MTRTELKERAVNVYNYYQWYKVYYHICLSGKQYVTFKYALNTAENPHAIETLVKKLGDDFIAVVEWNI